MGDALPRIRAAITASPDGTVTLSRPDARAFLAALCWARGHGIQYPDRMIEQLEAQLAPWRH